MAKHFPMVSKAEVFATVHAVDLQLSAKGDAAASERCAAAFRGSTAVSLGFSSRLRPSLSCCALRTGLRSRFLSLHFACCCRLKASAEDRQFLMSLILHCADISNPTARSVGVAELQNRVVC